MERKRSALKDIETSIVLNPRWVVNGTVVMCPGMSDLMRIMFRQDKSLHAAANDLKMAYSKAWKMFKKAEQATGVKYFEYRDGNAQHGMKLSKEGEKVFRAYNDYTRELAKVKPREKDLPWN
jgi:molybdate transport repressor ModE-like protein